MKFIVKAFVMGDYIDTPTYCLIDINCESIIRESEKIKDIFLA